MRRIHERSVAGKHARFRVLQLEGLESRVALSGTTHVGRVLGTISGQVDDATTGDGLRHVQVQLINGNGQVVARTFSDATGQYRFAVRREGPYVVHAVTPRRFVQTTPTFSTEEPTGSYAPGANGSSWNYGTNTDPSAGPVGPAGWAAIAPAGNEPFESPLNIKTPATDLSRVLSVNFNDGVTRRLLNNGHQIQVQFPATTGNTLMAGGQTFTLTQFHIHEPSETTVQGRHYALEGHFVTASPTGGEMVLGIFFKLGAHNPALDPILAAASNATTSGSTATISAPINLSGLLPKDRRGWYYEGSLTTPPLSQPVNWFVFQTPVTLDVAQLAAYEQVARAGGFLPNARPIQPTDGRRLNEIDYDVNFQGQSVAGLEFALTRRA
jgi:carbonic anhydrase